MKRQRPPVVIRLRIVRAMREPLNSSGTELATAPFRCRHPDCPGGVHYSNARRDASTNRFLKILFGGLGLMSVTTMINAIPVELD